MNFHAHTNEESAVSPVRYVTQCIKINLFQYNPNHSQLLRYEALGIGHDARPCDDFFILIYIFALSSFWIRIRAFSDGSICHSLATI